MLLIPAQFSFFLSGVHKGLGLQLLCEHLNIPINETVAFGDGENDREFLSAAGVGCAMKNARPAAKEAADIIIQVNVVLLLLFLLLLLSLLLLLLLFKFYSTV